MGKRRRACAALGLAAALAATGACGSARDDYIESRCGRMRENPELYDTCAGYAGEAYDSLPEDAR